METISEAVAISANNNINKLYDKNGMSTANFVCGFKRGAEFVQRWIPIEEELPPFNIWLNVKIGNYYATTKLSGDIDLKFLKSTFTHWRPIELE